METMRWVQLIPGSKCHRRWHVWVYKKGRGTLSQKSVSYEFVHHRLNKNYRGPRCFGSQIVLFKKTFGIESTRSKSRVYSTGLISTCLCNPVTGNSPWWFNFFIRVQGLAIIPDSLAQLWFCSYPLGPCLSKLPKILPRPLYG